MAKESIKARERKREQLVEKFAEKRKALKRSRRLYSRFRSFPKMLLRSACTTVANLRAARKDICGCLGFPVSISGKWQSRV